MRLDSNPTNTLESSMHYDGSLQYTNKTADIESFSTKELHNYFAKDTNIFTNTNNDSATPTSSKESASNKNSMDSKDSLQSLEYKEPKQALESTNNMAHSSDTKKKHQIQQDLALLQNLQKITNRIKLWNLTIQQILQTLKVSYATLPIKTNERTERIE